MDENPQVVEQQQQNSGVNIPKTIAEDVRNLNAAITNMNNAIKSVSLAKQKLHDDTELWVKNNIQRAMQVEQVALQEEKAVQ